MLPFSLFVTVHHAAGTAYFIYRKGFSIVIAGLDQAIHLCPKNRQAWIPGMVLQTNNSLKITLD